MKTKLPKSITTIEEAKALLSELHKNSEAFHPEDNAHEIEWLGMDDGEKKPTIKECDQLNKLMADIYALPGNESAQNMAFDPCEYLLELLNNN